MLRRAHEAAPDGRLWADEKAEDFLSKPYYSDASGIHIFLGDCRDIVPSLPTFDRVITDQPYGTGWVSGSGKEPAGRFYARGAREAWDIWDLSWMEMVKQAKTVASFCPVSKLKDFLCHVDSYSLRFFIKNNPRPACWNADAPSVEPIVIIPHVPRQTNSPQHFICHNWHETEHPTEKPLALMKWLVEGLSMPGDCILDPFLGSGTTLVACKALGRYGIGCESNERYAEIAANRLRQSVITFPEQPPASQIEAFHES